MRLLLAALLILLASPALAGLPDLELGARLYQRDKPQCCAAPAIERVNGTQATRVWYAVAAFHADSGFVWERRDLIYLDFPDGRRVWALEQFAVSSPERGDVGIVPLEGRISSDMVNRQRARLVKRHRGEVGTVLYVGFPVGTDARGAEVRVGRR